ncbi:MAG: aromatic ring-hydroxylating dioxygenase subunit alpha [Phycisphaerae bacterium]
MSEPVAPIHADIRQAQTLPGHFYADRGLHTLCRERVFAPSWQFVGDTEHVRVPGQVQPFTLLEGCLDEPLLLTRDDADQLHCLSNVCTHRGALVCEHAGVERHLRCRYHGRRFSLDGAFEHMPEFEQTAGFPTAADNLPRLALRAWGPLLFASLKPATPFEDWLGPVCRRMGWLPLDEFRFDPGRSRDYVVQANWALYCDNYLEGFHIPFVHATLADAIDYGAYRTDLFAEGSVQVAVAKGGDAVFDLPAGSADHGARIAAYYFWLFPNLMLNFYPWGLSINVVRPLAVDRTRVSFLSYVWRPERIDRGPGSGLDRVEREDEAVVESVQRGIRARLYSAGRYSPTREQGVHHFHRMLVERLNARTP